MSADGFELAKQEYIKLKDEQTKRIGFRDNLLYVNLLLIGGIFSFVFSSDRAENVWKFSGLLAAGWVALILGWTYLVNDEKISAIERYIRAELRVTLGDDNSSQLFGWEVAHRSDRRRKRRKVEQFVVDEISFVGVGILAVILFLALSPLAGFWPLAISIIEIFLLIVLGVEIFVYADFGIGGASRRSYQMPPLGDT